VAGGDDALDHAARAYIEFNKYLVKNHFKIFTALLKITTSKRFNNA
jgi:hypothetical protein